MQPDLLAIVYNRPWAILPEYLHHLAAAVRDNGLLAPVLEAAIPGERRRTGNVAVLPIMGTIMPRSGGSFFDMLFGGMSLEQFAADFRQAVADESVRAIVLNIDSPGGSVAGVDEMATEIMAARGSKPIIAVANTMAASAAYYLASQADELVVSPSAEVGSIGVLSLHLDFSRQADAAGVTPTFLTAGRFKAEAHPLRALTYEAAAYQQERVNAYYDAFVSAVARGRGSTAAAVRGGMGEGRMVGAKDAVKLGMADRIATLYQTLARLGAGGSAQRTGAEEEPPEVVAALTAESDESTAGTLDYRRRRFRMRSR